MTSSADSLNELGRELQSKGLVADAERAYRAASDADPAWSVPWYNLGLLYKVAGRWSESIECNERAVQLDPSDGDAWWNLGIAATAVSDWSRARRAWRSCGIDMPAGEEEPRMNYGLVPIRLDPGSEGEVVWCDRIDPARAIVRNIPLPRTGYREGDLLLHDGAPNGHRVWNGRQYPVFDALQTLVPSTNSTFELVIYALDGEAVATLERLAVEHEIPIEDWETIEWICRQCSEGIPHEEHDRTPGPWKAERRIGASSPSDKKLRRLLDSWIAQVPGVRVLNYHRASAA